MADDSVERIWTMSDNDLVDELSRPVHPDERAGYLVLRVAVSRILAKLAAGTDSE